MAAFLGSSAPQTLCSCSASRELAIFVEGDGDRPFPCLMLVRRRRLGVATCSQTCSFQHRPFPHSQVPV